MRLILVLAFCFASSPVFGDVEKRWTNPADHEFCARPETLRAMARVVPRIVRIEQVKAGEQYCFSADERLCRPNPKSKVRACHALTVWVDFQKPIPSVFTIDKGNALNNRFMSDFQRNANGM
ncbi:hypothetical protein ONR75_10345 [Rhodopseudomonas sp. P2A-2r]|uniref:hypothetical protein n=1 Tax=Rhodopseudomonas sp. P2A-2r TaxID=2991972 RepID=UPI0022343361|nr:hypothetical protein [Rhodopseudomonas sp. P2A-2r]UZE50979.1 hypothetical protein ONR75_10345 [Rhodopseudomonas sp. P2A-2r]